LQSSRIGTQQGPGDDRLSLKRIQNIAKEWKEDFPFENHTDFDAILDVGRRVFRMHDEQGLCIDMSGIGLCHRGIMESGRRLSENGLILRAEHLCVATKQEALPHLAGDIALLSREGEKISGGLGLPTYRELESRDEYIFSADPSRIPRELGTPHPNPGIN